ncbi:ketoacyl-CoA reductase [Zostera marina]|uniref:Ketoacyl-CoA reductase n=1 Tax=Zostera marina TaxID=29655 RepID=A0A0K9PTH8_ZOSMR|nr:ketoacyl-CoA reductase [Zostera marina]
MELVDVINSRFLEHIPVDWIVVMLAFGGLVILKYFIFFLRWIYVYFLRPCKDLKRVYGSWAIVTGSTDGIGRAMALELGRKGMNLVLIGRNPGKLKAVSDEILTGEYCRGSKDKDSIRVKTVVFDMSGDLIEGIALVGEAIKGLDVGVLVNNAGLANSDGIFFHEGRLELWREIVKINVEAMTMVSKVVIDGMIERGRGAIVNIGSGCTVVGSFPLFAVYCATKGYVEHFSRSLHAEYKRSGIDVQCQAPFYVYTNMTAKYQKTSFFVPSPERYAKAAVSWIGYDSVCIPYINHSLQAFILSILPEFVINAYLMRVGMRFDTLKRNNN